MVMLTLASPCLANKVYKYTDSNGKTHYSDSAVDGAEEVKLPPIQVYSSPEPQAPALPDASDQENAVKEAPVQYKLAISHPEDNFTVENGVQELDVTVFTEPSLQTDDVVQLMVDGKRIGEPTRELTFTLKDELIRGEHTIKAILFNRKDSKKVDSAFNSKR